MTDRFFTEEDLHSMWQREDPSAPRRPYFPSLTSLLGMREPDVTPEPEAYDLQPREVTIANGKWISCRSKPPKDRRLELVRILRHKPNSEWGRFFMLEDGNHKIWWEVCKWLKPADEKLKGKPKSKPESASEWEAKYGWDLGMPLAYRRNVPQIEAATLWRTALFGRELAATEARRSAESARVAAELRFQQLDRPLPFLLEIRGWQSQPQQAPRRVVVVAEPEGLIRADARYYRRYLPSAGAVIGATLEEAEAGAEPGWLGKSAGRSI